MSALKTVKLGETGIVVSELCFGTLTASPIQSNLPSEEAGRLIRLAFDGGVNFIDTAQSYGNYAHVKAGILGLDRDRLVIATKSAARTASEMQAAFDQARAEMDVERIDIFMLHSVRSHEDFQARRGALDLLLQLKARGFVRAVGLSTHALEPLRKIIGVKDIDVCHPIFNKDGLGIKNGGVSDMADVLAELHAEGKGVYVMKPLGGGRLAANAVESFEFVRRHEAVDAVAVGMKDDREIVFNLACFRDESVTDSMKRSVSSVPRRLHINFLCRKCGACVEFCEHEAVRMGNERAEVDAARCVLCGYCVEECPEFAIRVI